MSADFAQWWARVQQRDGGQWVVGAACPRCYLPFTPDNQKPDPANCQCGESMETTEVLRVLGLDAAPVGYISPRVAQQAVEAR